MVWKLRGPNRNLERLELQRAICEMDSATVAFVWFIETANFYHKFVQWPGAVAQVFTARTFEGRI